MKKLTTLLLCFMLLPAVAMYGQAMYDFEEVVLDSERNPHLERTAKLAAMDKGNPINIYFEQEQVHIDAINLDANGEPLYMVVRNFLHPHIDGEIMTFAQIEQSFNLSNAYVNYGQGSGRQFEVSAPTPLNDNGDVALVLIPNSGDNSVMAFDYVSGNLVDPEFIPEQPTEVFGTPQHVLLSAAGTILVSDQIRDVVQEFNLNGDFIGTFAPAGGVDNTLIDNIRGIRFRDNGNLLVTAASGGNAHAVAEFDANGEYVGRFIDPDTNPMRSPWYIYEREDTYLISGINAPQGIHRYDVDGNYIDMFSSGWGTFPQQIGRRGNGFAVAQFSGATTSGLVLLDANGNQTGL